MCAPVRTAARRRADLARGFTSSSAFEGVNGRGVNNLETGCLQFYRLHRQVPRAAHFLAGTLLQEPLHDAIFQRVEGDDHQPAARLQGALGGGKSASQLAQLVIHVDAQRLEGLRRRMLRITAPAADRARDKLASVLRGGDGAIFSTCLYDQTRQ